MPTPGIDKGLAADFAALSPTLNARVGVVIHAVGSAPDDPIILGDWQSGVAWSTSKVPLVVAALRLQDSSEITEAMTKAITESDNAAAESIWEGLGDPTQAAEQVQGVLRQYGDPTIVQSTKVRPEYTAFGQTVWPLVDQNHFMAGAMCDPNNSQVIDLMGRVEDDQRWGLGSIAGAKFKGGWGPAPSGNYLVRQMGVIPTPGGFTAITIAAEPNSGSFADGTEVLTRVAQWLGEHLADLPAAQCGS
ncbi:hypothetical protein MMAD_17500 [Mycolicibacterium madagascariense]|uniref:Serine hydrolase n=1 Tax=Mycolicibacterium madagascariense TaxID=212765 RepID=A0A7I7XDI3_9MYCO|nr:hypothetical protein [Mycolicibacterium madagascariense]BBZ27455.1 hypothetical protein MMAD_17500 [Mycolicibacterium madagascariense]